MDGKRTYQIVINGLTESANAVESLNKQLDALENKINKINSSKVSTGSSSRGSSSTSLSDEEAVQREINRLKEEGQKLDAKIAATQDEIFKRVDATKELYKETLADQKAIAAQERLTADAYSNTMVGMKQQLADIKAVIQTTDMGDTDKIKKMTEQANELTNKLKKMEEAYGQFGRNVGNYANGVAEGLQKVKITVGDTVREFSSAREASRTLNNELKTMAANGQQDTEAFKQLRQVVMELESNINDAKKPMDSIMDSMEGVMAVANAGQGIRALFGVDDAEIQKSIKNLVALQNVLKGLETINKQIQTREGVGKWIAPFTTQIDAATAKLLKFNTALLGTSKVSKVAAVGIKAFGTALKAAVSFGILVAVDLLVEKLMDLVESFKKVDHAAEAAKETQEEVSKAYANGSATLLKYQAIVKNFNGTKKEEERLVKELNSELGSSLGTYKTLGEWMDVLTKKGEAYIQMLILQAKAQAAFNNLVKAMQEQMNAKNASTDDYRTFINDFQDFLWSGWGTSSANKKRVAEIQMKNALVETGEKALAEAQNELQDYMKAHHIGDYAPQLEENGKKSKKTIEKVENELAKARIAAMKEGLNKTILQLEEERKARLAKLDRNAKDYKQQEAQWNQFYNDRILEETEKWSRKMNKVYSDLYSAIASYATNNLKMVATETKEELDRELKNVDDFYSSYNKLMAGYSPFAGMKMSPKTQKNLGIISFVDDKEYKQVKELITLEREYLEADIDYGNMFSENAKKHLKYQEELIKYKNEEKNLDEESKKAKAEELKIKGKDLQEEDKYLKLFEESLKERLDYINKFKKEIRESWKDDTYDDETFEIKFNSIKNALLDEGYLKDLSEVFSVRLKLQEAYWDNVEEVTKEGAEKEKKARLAALLKEQQEEDAANLAWRDKTIQDTLNYYKELREGYDAQLKNGLMPKDGEHGYLKKTTEAIKRQKEDIQSIVEEYKKRINNIEAKYETERLKINKESSDKINKVTVDELNQRMTEMRDFQTQISNLEQKQPVMNAWGMTNWTETKKNNQQIKDSYIELANALSNVRKKALDVLGDENASKEFKENAESVLREARNMAAGIGETLEELEYKMSNWAKTQTFFQDIQFYFQEVMNSLNTIMQAVWDYQDNAFDDEQEELDKWNEKLDKKLDEQEEIVEKHKDAIDAIEDELANARGTRRQHLIDQLNAEMQAQREAAAQQKKIEKEKEAAQKKQDDLDLRRKKAQYNRDMAQAVVNGAMAVTMAAVNTWPIPAIPMMALAAATTAAQIAIMASNKPYAKGGVLEGGVAVGNSHANGGIPVLGGRASIEGGEYITDKRTTAKNVDLLDYINGSHKKLDLDDFIEFYSSGRIRKNIISMSPKTKFADGGIIPTLSSDISSSDALINAIEAYAERPIYVSVVDINNKQEDVRRVQTLAGL